MDVSEKLSHLQPGYRPQALLSAEERLDGISQDRWINYTRADQVLARLSELMVYPPRSRMPCLLLFGATGMGKTHLIEKFLRDQRDGGEELTATAPLPVVSVQMPPAPHEKDFYEELLAALGTSVPDGVGVTSLRHRVRLLARQLEVRMVVISEIHSMLAGTFREQRIFLNALRFLANDLRIPLVCMGTQEARQALMTDQQLADRFEAFDLPAWKDDSTFAQLLMSFGSILPLRKASELCHPKLRKRILGLTDGVMVRICRLLEAATAQAIKSGRECIEPEVLTDELANDTLVSISDRRNRRTTG
jgi:hypothetical protein